MSHSAGHLTGNCAVASVLSCGAVHRSLVAAEAEEPHVTGVTGERLNCGGKEGIVKKNVLGISEYPFFWSHTEGKQS